MQLLTQPVCSDETQIVSSSIEGPGPDEEARSSERRRVAFDPQSWGMLTEMARAQGIDEGTMLGVAIARTWYLNEATAEGGILYLKRGRRFYRLRGNEGGALGWPGWRGRSARSPWTQP